MAKRRDNNNTNNNPLVDIEHYSGAGLDTDQRVDVLWEHVAAHCRELRQLNRWVTWGLGFAAALLFGLEVMRVVGVFAPHK